jgi:hypothetical protein
MRFGWLVLLYRPSRIQESLLFPFVLETRLRTIRTLTVFLLLVNQNRNVDTFWSRCHPLFTPLLTQSCDQGFTKLILTKGPSLDTRRCPTHYLHLMSTLSDEPISGYWHWRSLCAMTKPKFGGLLRTFPFCTSRYIICSFRRRKSSHTMTVST